MSARRSLAMQCTHVNMINSGGDCVVVGLGTDDDSETHAVAGGACPAARRGRRPRLLEEGREEAPKDQPANLVTPSQRTM